MVVGIHGHRDVRVARGAHSVLLYQTALVLPVLELDAMAGGCETGLPLVFVTLGDVFGDVARLAPCCAVVVGFHDDGLQHVARIFHTQYGAKVALIVRFHAEQEDLAGFLVDHIGRVGVAVFVGGAASLRHVCQRLP